MSAGGDRKSRVLTFLHGNPLAPGNVLQPDVVSTMTDQPPALPVEMAVTPVVARQTRADSVATGFSASDAARRASTSVYLTGKGASDWKALKDASGRTYYYSRSLRRASWTHPDGSHVPSDVSTSTQASSQPFPSQTTQESPVSSHIAGQSASNGRRSLSTQGDWVCVYDGASQQKYYYHKPSKITQWSPPEDWNALLEEPVAVNAIQPNSFAGYESSTPSLVETGGTSHTVAQVVEDDKPTADSGVPELSLPPQAMGSRPSRRLPYPWKRAVDPSSGHSYYINTVTRETTWDRPTSNEFMSPLLTTSLPSAWMSAVDPVSKRVYFFNRITFESSWTVPPGLLASLLPTDPPTDPAAEPSAWMDTSVSHGDWMQGRRKRTSPYASATSSGSSRSLMREVATEVVRETIAGANTMLLSPIRTPVSQTVGSTTSGRTRHRRSATDVAITTTHGGVFGIPTTEALPAPPRWGSTCHLIIILSWFDLDELRVCRWRGACKVFRSLVSRQGQGSPVCNLSGLSEPLTDALAISAKRAVTPSSVLLEG